MHDDQAGKHGQSSERPAPHELPSGSASATGPPSSESPRLAWVAVPNSNNPRRFVDGHHEGDVPGFERTRSGRLVATEKATRPHGGFSLAWYRVWHILIGKPIPSEYAVHERLGRFQALAVLSSDALSSVAYGPEQVFLQ